MFHSRRPVDRLKRQTRRDTRRTVPTLDVRIAGMGERYMARMNVSARNLAQRFDRRGDPELGVVSHTMPGDADEDELDHDPAFGFQKLHPDASLTILQ